MLRARPEAGVVFCTDVFIDADGMEFGRLALPPEIAAAPLLDYRLVLNGFLRHKNAFIRGGSGLFRREVLLEVGPFDPAFDLRADLEMWLRLARRAPIAILDEYLVRYRFGHENSSRRYDRLRVEPEFFFEIVDRELATAGSGIAEPDALAAYEGHRAEDLLFVAVNRYIVGDRRGARDVLRAVRLGALAGTNHVDRKRLVVLLLSMRGIVRLPRIPPLAALLYERWHGRGVARKKRPRTARPSSDAASEAVAA